MKVRTQTLASERTPGGVPVLRPPTVEELAQRKARQCLDTNTRPEDWYITTGDGERLPRSDRDWAVITRANELLLELSSKH